MTVYRLSDPSVLREVEEAEARRMWREVVRSKRAPRKVRAVPRSGGDWLTRWEAAREA